MNDSSSFRRFDRRLIFVSDDVVPDLLADLDHFGLQVDRLQQLVHGLGAHAGIELVAVLLDRLEVHLVGQQLAALQLRSCPDR